MGIRARRYRRMMKWLTYPQVALVLALLLFSIALPYLLPVLLNDNTASGLVWTERLTRFNFFVLGGFGYLWFFFFGACIASFVNVVAYRLPRGRGILGRSACPYCNTRLSARVNIPIYGWVSSNGRCRSCRLPISPRYLVVEILLGVMFVVCLHFGWVLGGRFLPNIDQPIPVREALVSATLIGSNVYLLLLISILFTCAIIQIDRQRYPVSLLAFGVISGLGLALIWPFLFQVPAFEATELAKNGTISRVQVLTSVGIGCLVGVLIGIGFWVVQFNPQRVQDSRRSRDHLTSIFVWGIVGVFLGWQAVVTIAFLTSLIGILFALASHIVLSTRLVSSMWLLLLGAIVQICFWKPIAHQFETFIGGQVWIRSALFVGVSLVVVRLGQFLTNPDERLSRPRRVQTDNGVESQLR